MACVSLLSGLVGLAASLCVLYLWLGELNLLSPHKLRVWIRDRLREYPDLALRRPILTFVFATVIAIFGVCLGAGAPYLFASCEEVLYESQLEKKIDCGRVKLTRHMWIRWARYRCEQAAFFPSLRSPSVACGAGSVNFSADSPVRSRRNRVLGLAGPPCSAEGLPDTTPHEAPGGCAPLAVAGSAGRQRLAANHAEFPVEHGRPGQNHCRLPELGRRAILVSVPGVRGVSVHVPLGNPVVSMGGAPRRYPRQKANG
jgi:hypothetical protein